MLDLLIPACARCGGSTVVSLTLLFCSIAQSHLLCFGITWYDVHDELLELEDELDDEDGVAKPLWRNIAHCMRFGGGATGAGAPGRDPADPEEELPPTLVEATWATETLV